MNHRNLATNLTVIVWGFWAIPFLGKQFLPTVFDSALIQWTSAVIVAILIPVVVLIALEMIYNEHLPRVGLGGLAWRAYHPNTSKQVDDGA